MDLASSLSYVSDELAWDSMPVRQCKTLEGEGKPSRSLGDNPSGFGTRRPWLQLLLLPVLIYSFHTTSY